jgi:taurine dioxygenase
MNIAPARRFTATPLAGASFGARVDTMGDAAATVAAAEAEPAALPRLLYQAGGLLVLSGLGGIRDDAALLLRLSQLFGDEIEDYSANLTPAHMVHPQVPQVLIVSNVPPVSRMPPKRPEPPTTADGGLPLQFPHRRGWHSDQSYRRPPPDISLFFAHTPTPQGQGQTLYADGAGAYDALPPALKARVETLEGLHVMPGTGRSEDAVRNGETPRPLRPHERSQRQPVVRTHPVTGRKALYLCEAGQMDWVEGPFVGMAPGPDGDGARLLYEIMAHYTQPRFVYAHEWSPGDLVIYDNRSMIHAATWFDAEKHGRVMWRTTVSGNPGPLYAGEPPSWVPR